MRGACAPRKSCGGQLQAARRLRLVRGAWAPRKGIWRARTNGSSLSSRCGGHGLLASVMWRARTTARRFHFGVGAWATRISHVAGTHKLLVAFRRLSWRHDRTSGDALAPVIRSRRGFNPLPGRLKLAAIGINGGVLTREGFTTVSHQEPAQCSMTDSIKPLRTRRANIESNQCQ